MRSIVPKPCGDRDPDASGEHTPFFNGPQAPVRPVETSTQGSRRVVAVVRIGILPVPTRSPALRADRDAADAEPTEVQGATWRSGIKTQVPSAISFFAHSLSSGARLARVR